MLIHEKYGDSKLKRNDEKIEEYKKDWRGTFINYIVYGVKPTMGELEGILYNEELRDSKSKFKAILKMSEPDSTEKTLELIRTNLEKEYKDLVNRDPDYLVYLVENTWIPELGKDLIQEVYDGLIKGKHFRYVNSIVKHTGIEPKNPIYLEYKEIKKREKGLKKKFASESDQEDLVEKAIYYLQKGRLDELEELIKKKGVVLPKEVVLGKYSRYLFGHYQTSSRSQISDLKRVMDLTGVEVPLELLEKKYILSILHDDFCTFAELWHTLKIRPTGELFEHRFKSAVHRYATKRIQRTVCC